MQIDTLKLLRGKVIKIDNVGELKPIIVDEVVDIGEKQFYKYLNNLCFDVDDLQLGFEEKQRIVNEKITTFQILVSGCYHDLEHLQLILKALKFFFKNDVCFLREYGIFFFGDFEESLFITSDNYELIKSILKLQNGISKNEFEDENPNDERTKLLLEKRKKAREKLAKAKAKNNNGESEPLSFADIVSIMCSNANGVTNENVWYMNFYFFQDQFQRMKLIEDYDINIKSILAGANPDEIDVKHYMSHI